MAKTTIQYDVNLTPLNIKNKERNAFREDLKSIPYALYEVEQLQDGKKIVINKPGAKRKFGRLSPDDFTVYIYSPEESSLWLIRHEELKEDLIAKKQKNEKAAIALVHALYAVCNGTEPEQAQSKYKPSETVGLSVETILKVYKWIWGQEDCNYPTGDGRWMSMKDIMQTFALEHSDFEV